MSLPSTALKKSSKLANFDNGRTEDKVLEQLLGDIAEWFIDNPAPTWRQELIGASGTTRIQEYSY
jgi:hypothetical protein